jgi:hypothetical protein
MRFIGNSLPRARHETSSVRRFWSGAIELELATISIPFRDRKELPLISTGIVGRFCIFGVFGRNYPLESELIASTSRV